MKNWFETNHAKLQFALRMMLAALASFALGEALGLAQTYWAVLSAVIVIQASIGGSVRAAINRLTGTLGGAFWGALVAMTIPHGSPASMAVALIAGTAPLAIFTAFRPEYRIAPITAIIVLLGGGQPQAGPFSSALERVLEISLGSAVAVAVALLILPARAHRLLAHAASGAVADMARIVSMLDEAHARGASPEALWRLQVRLSAEVAGADSRAGEAKVERANYLAEGPDPEPLARTLRRLRNDLAMLSRALGASSSDALHDGLRSELSPLLRAIAGWFNALAKALASGEPAPSLETIRATVEDYRAAISCAGDEGLASVAGGEGNQRVFVLLFVFEQMLQNLQDLAARTNELSESDSKRSRV